MGTIKDRKGMDLTEAELVNDASKTYNIRRHSLPDLCRPPAQTCTALGMMLP